MIMSDLSIQIKLLEDRIKQYEAEETSRIRRIRAAEISLLHALQYKISTSANIIVIPKGTFLGNVLLTHTTSETVTDRTVTIETFYSYESAAYTTTQDVTLLYTEVADNTDSINYGITDTYVINKSYPAHAILKIVFAQGDSLTDDIDLTLFCNANI